MLSPLSNHKTRICSTCEGLGSWTGRRGWLFSLLLLKLNSQLHSRGSISTTTPCQPTSRVGSLVGSRLQSRRHHHFFPPLINKQSIRSDPILPVSDIGTCRTRASIPSDPSLVHLFSTDPLLLCPLSSLLSSIHLN